MEHKREAKEAPQELLLLVHLLQGGVLLEGGKLLANAMLGHLLSTALLEFVDTRQELNQRRRRVHLWQARHVSLISGESL